MKNKMLPFQKGCLPGGISIPFEANNMAELPSMIVNAFTFKGQNNVDEVRTQWAHDVKTTSIQY